MAYIVNAFIDAKGLPAKPRDAEADDNKANQTRYCSNRD